MKTKKEAGEEGEQIAVELLQEKGYEIIERNYRFGKGEIDIIAKQGDALVFVEVKTKTNLEYGTPEAAVTKTKQRQIKKVAEGYLYENEIMNTICRIDVIAILMEGTKISYINHIENAF